MVCRSIDFALVVLKLMMFKVCVIIDISKIEFFNFSGTEKVKKFISVYHTKVSRYHTKVLRFAYGMTVWFFVI